MRGVNLYPTQIEEVLQSISDVAMHYQLALSRQGTLDTCELRLELAQDAFYRLGQEVLSEELLETDQYLSDLRNKVQHKIKDTVGVNVRVNLLAPGSAPRSAGGKLRRIVDERNL